MHAEQARVIIIQARKDEVYEGPIPEDDSKAIEEANALVNMAKQAWEMNAKGPQVEAILRLSEAHIPEKQEVVAEVSLADVAQLSSDPVHENGNGLIVQENAPEVAPQVLLDAPEAEVRVERTPEVSIEPDPVPQVPVARGPSTKLAKIEPWQDYSNDRVPVIVETLENGLAGESDPLELLRHVEAFEKAHKDRSRILNKVKEFRIQYADAGSPEAEPEPVALPEPDVQVPENAQTDLLNEISKMETRWQNTSHNHENGDNEFDYQNMLSIVKDELSENNFHAPKKLPEEKTELPFNLSVLADAQLHSIYGEFAVYGYAAAHQMTLQESIVRGCCSTADEIHKYLLTSSEKYDSEKKPKTMTILEAEIEQNADIKFWRKKQHQHSLLSQVYRNERDSYYRLAESLSRLETMRQNAFTRSGS